MRMQHALLVAIYGASVGCQGKEGEATDTADPESGCACIEPIEYGSASYTCPKDTCGRIEARCRSQAPEPSTDTDTGTDTDTDIGTDTDTGGSNCDFEVDEAGLNCALDRLIQGQTGFVVEYSFSADEGYTVDGGFLDILAADRRGLMRTWRTQDPAARTATPASFSSRTRPTLKAARASPIWRPGSGA
jgi:hypothetical protein